MRKIVIVPLCLMLSSISFANSSLSINLKDTTSIPLNIENETINSFIINNVSDLSKKVSNNLLGKCTIRVNITLDDGTRVKGKVTFHDVGFFECIGIKAANLWSKLF